ncbi:hypothetical protein Tco_0901702 [Tanacetum coccineum]
MVLDRKAILDHLTWRHSCSCVSDDLPSDGYDRNDVQRLCARLICLCEMREEVLTCSGLSSMWINKESDLVFRRVDDNAGRLGVILFIPCLLFLLACVDRCFAFYAKMSIYDFTTLPSWSDAKIAEESHHLSLSLLERVPSNTTAPATEGAIIMLPTPDEIVASLPDSRLVKKSKGTDEADLADLCVEIKDSLERDEGVSMRAVSAPTSRLGVVASGCVWKSGAEVMRRQMDPLDCLAHSALARDAKYDQIPDDDFGIATRGEEIDLTRD